MSTLKQIEANRRNALRSTGPKTTEGKAAVRLNALRHGLYAKSVALPGENRENFEQLCDEFEKEWQPQTLSEHSYVEEMAACYWKKIRMQVAENSILAQDPPAKEQIRLADILWKAQARLQRAFTRAQHELQILQKERRRQSAQPPQAVPLEISAGVRNQPGFKMPGSGLPQPDVGPGWMSPRHATTSDSTKAGPGKPSPFHKP